VVAKSSEMIDRAFDRGLKIRIDPGVPDRRPRAPESDKRLVEVLQIVNARIAYCGVGDDQRIDEAALGHAAQRFEAVVGRVLEKDRKIEALLREPTLEAGEHEQEHHVDRRVVGAGGDKDADKIGLAASKAAARLVGRIAQFGRSVANALARERVDVGAVVQRPRDGADRDVEMTGQFANSNQCVRPFCEARRRRDDGPRTVNAKLPARCRA